MVCDAREPTSLSRPLRLRLTDLVWHELDGDIIALDQSAARYLAVNASAGVIWKVLAGGCEREDLVRALIAEHKLERAIAERDVDAFMAELSAHHLLRDDQPSREGARSDPA